MREVTSKEKSTLHLEHHNITSEKNELLAKIKIEKDRLKKFPLRSLSQGIKIGSPLPTGDMMMR
jgi:hypothetical protein